MCGEIDDEIGYLVIQFEVFWKSFRVGAGITNMELFVACVNGGMDGTLGIPIGENDFPPD